MSAPFDEPTIPARLRRPLAAAWISLGLHAALIALVQVAPPAAVNLGEPAIEARLVPAHAAPPAVETPPVTEPETPDDTADETPAPPLVPSEQTEAMPAVEPVVGPPAQPAPPAAASQTTDSPAEPLPPSAPATTSAPVAAITSAVDLTYYSARDLDVQPRALREIEPDYPYDADRQRQSGKVRLQLKLEADGRISDIDVVSAAPPGVFDESAIRAFRDARFAPAQKNGRPVRARVVIEVLYDWEGRARQQ
ncbi:MAG TPA: energy transducer TonB [Steroidobacteraceae bacterium]|nr:energy transducer TonB [Steroidobacteraceae bacterium]